MDSRTRSVVERSEFAQWFEARGEVKAGARATLAVLDARGFDVLAQVRRRITECVDPAQLDVWVRRAAIAEKIEDLFG